MEGDTAQHSTHILRSPAHRSGRQVGSMWPRHRHRAIVIIMIIMGSRGTWDHGPGTESGLWDWYRRRCRRRRRRRRPLHLEVGSLGRVDRTRLVQTIPVAVLLEYLPPHRRPAVSLAFYFLCFWFFSFRFSIFSSFFFWPSIGLFSHWLTLLYNPVWRVVLLAAGV